MGSLIETVKTANAAARTTLLAGLVAVLGFGSFFAYNVYTKRDRQLLEKDEQIEFAQKQLDSMQSKLDQQLVEISELNGSIKKQAAQIDKLQTAMHLLKTDQRLAQLRVLEIERDEDGKALSSKLEFVELSPAGDALSEPKQFTLPGDLIYIDNWIVKFDDSYVEKGDIERGTSLCLFRRVFSEEQKPNQGFSLDEVGMRPQAYSRGGQVSDFEKRLWADFWEFANNREKAAEMGIRAANGEAVSIKVREDMTYQVSLRSSGGLSVQPLPTNR